MLFFLMLFSFFSTQAMTYAPSLMCRAPSPDLPEERADGFLTIFAGPMYAGKTTALMDLVKHMRLQNKEVILIKPNIDTRNITVSTHDARELFALNVDVQHPEIIEEIVRRNGSSYIAIDEIQFFNESLIPVIDRLLYRGCRIYAAGLDKNFLGLPFNSCMASLLARADKVKKLTAVCVCCKRANATMTQRLINGIPAPANSPLVLIEHSDAQVTYEPRCRCDHIIGGMHDE